MAGFVAYYNTNNEEGLLDRMLDVISYRGPDYRLKYEDESISIGYVGLDLQYEFDKKEIFESDEKIVLLNGYVSNIDEIKSYISETYKLETSGELQQFSLQGVKLLLEGCFKFSWSHIQFCVNPFINVVVC